MPISSFKNTNWALPAANTTYPRSFPSVDTEITLYYSERLTPYASWLDNNAANYVEDYQPLTANDLQVF